MEHHDLAIVAGNDDSAVSIPVNVQASGGSRAPFTPAPAAPSVLTSPAMQAAPVAPAPILTPTSEPTPTPAQAAPTPPPLASVAAMLTAEAPAAQAPEAPAPAAPSPQQPVHEHAIDPELTKPYAMDLMTGIDELAEEPEVKGLPVSASVASGMVEVSANPQPASQQLKPTPLEDLQPKPVLEEPIPTVHDPAPSVSPAQPPAPAQPAPQNPPAAQTPPAEASAEFVDPLATQPVTASPLAASTPVAAPALAADSTVKSDANAKPGAPKSPFKEQPKTKRSIPLIPVIAAVAVVLALGVLGYFALTKSGKSLSIGSFGKNSASRVKLTPLASDEVADKSSVIEEELNTQKEALDYDESALSDAALGL